MHFIAFFIQSISILLLQASSLIITGVSIIDSAAFANKYEGDVGSVAFAFSYHTLKDYSKRHGSEGNDSSSVKLVTLPFFFDDANLTALESFASLVALTKMKETINSLTNSLKCDFAQLSIVEVDNNSFNFSSTFLFEAK